MYGDGAGYGAGGGGGGGGVRGSKLSRVPRNETAVGVTKTRGGEQ